MRFEGRRLQGTPGVARATLRAVGWPARLVALLALVSTSTLVGWGSSPSTAIGAPAGAAAGAIWTAAGDVQGAAPPIQVPDFGAAPPLHLTATTLREYDVPEADQGVAVDAVHFYALDNTVIGKYEIATGRLVDRWIGPHRGFIRHMNSCFAESGRLWCANSNYSLIPMGSSIEIFDAAPLGHRGTHSLGLRDEGSLTWFDRYGAGWIAGFAHYQGNGGLGYKDHRFSNVVTFDAEWRRTGGWLFPDTVVQRFAPRASSGGAIGPDGLLYTTGHDRPEMYVLGRPTMGPTLVHLATIDLDLEGQAFSWAPGPDRVIYGVARHRAIRAVRAISIPPVPAPDPALAHPFR